MPQRRKNPHYLLEFMLEFMHNYDFVHLPMESTTTALGCVPILLNTTRLFEPLVVISAMMPSMWSV